MFSVSPVICGKSLVTKCGASSRWQSFQPERQFEKAKDNSTRCRTTRSALDEFGRWCFGQFGTANVSKLVEFDSCRLQYGTDGRHLIATYGWYRRPWTDCHGICSGGRQWWRDQPSLHLVGDSSPRRWSSYLCDQCDKRRQEQYADLQQGRLYTVRVAIRDAQGLETTSTLNISVVPTLTSLRVNTTDGRTVASGSSLSVSSTSQAFTVVGSINLALRWLNNRWCDGRPFRPLLDQRPRTRSLLRYPPFALTERARMFFESRLELCSPSLR